MSEKNSSRLQGDVLNTAGGQFLGIPAQEVVAPANRLHVQRTEIGSVIESIGLFPAFDALGADEGWEASFITSGRNRSKCLALDGVIGHVATPTCPRATPRKIVPWPITGGAGMRVVSAVNHARRSCRALWAYKVMSTLSLPRVSFSTCKALARGIRSRFHEDIDPCDMPKASANLFWLPK